MPNWLIPMAYSAAALIGGFVVPRLDHAYLTPHLTDISMAAALALLSAVAAGMMAFTAIVFSIAYITVQFNAIAYSPRLALWFADNPRTFHALGLFIATFLDALSTIAWIDRGRGGGVPLLSTIIVVALLVASTLQFSRLVRGLNDMQISNTLRWIGNQGRKVIAEMFPRVEASATPAPADCGLDDRHAPSGPPAQILRYAGDPRAIGSFDIGRLVALAQRAGAVIESQCAVGDTILDDTALFHIYGPNARIPEAALLAAVDLVPQRTFAQDPKYALRLLVDIAIKALSPAVNDPTTAVQALDEIEDLLRRLGRRRLDPGIVADSGGAVRLILPMPTWDDYLRLAFDEIRQYGGGSVQVVRRLRAALAGVAEAVAMYPERAASVQHYLEHLDHVIDRSALDFQDRQVASEADRQGLGLSRGRRPSPSASSSLESSKLSKAELGDPRAQSPASARADAV
ncbi:MAG TPA: DUF2254 family protein [Stellaceae bacterium]|nr:DUF2254 family protein [Stellaceae bacterium]